MFLEGRPDIFKAWNHNLDNERRKGRRVARKLSHRAQRKEFLKQHSYPKVTGTLNISYVRDKKEMKRQSQKTKDNREGLGGLK